MLQAHAAPHVSSLRDGREFLTPGNRYLDGLLHQNGLSCRGCSLHRRQMRSRGRQYQDEIEIGARQQILLAVENRNAPLL